jgi:cytochrome c553
MRRQVISLAINALALTALAFVPAQAADNAAIKEKAAVCSGCHGENGISQTENIP